jgi:hypothetical protein
MTSLAEGTVKITDEGVPIDELIAVIKNSIKLVGVSRDSDTGELLIASVELILKLVATIVPGGGLNFRVPFIGMKLSAGAGATRHEILATDITLMLPDQTLMLPDQPSEREVRSSEVEHALVDAITTIRETMASAAADTPRILSAETVDISFAVTEAGTITLGIDSDLASDLTHTLRLGLRPTLGTV